MLSHAQLFRPLDRLDAAGLVKPVAVEFVHLRQHAGSPLALWAAHQRLVGKHLVRLHIHNGLVGKFKGKPTRSALPQASQSARVPAKGWKPMGKEGLTLITWVMRAPEE